MKHPNPNEIEFTEEIVEFDDSRDRGLLLPSSGLVQDWGKLQNIPSKMQSAESGSAGFICLDTQP